MINLLCNRNINAARASVHSVTRELQYIQVNTISMVVILVTIIVVITKVIILHTMQQGKLRKVGEDGLSKVQKTNIIDTIGFCDSVFTPKQVLNVIKASVKVNVCHIDKVVVVCSGRIEGHHAQAIGQFMKWLEYKKHRNQFVFVYNKADHCDSEEEKLENVAGMLELLGAKQVTRTLTDDLADGLQSKVVSGIHTGFPKKVRSSSLVPYFLLCP